MDPSRNLIAKDRSKNELTFFSGPLSETKDLKWTIQNFKAAIEMGKLEQEFYIGESLGMLSKWAFVVYDCGGLRNAWIGVVMRELPKDQPYVYADFQLLMQRVAAPLSPFISKSRVNRIDGGGKLHGEFILSSLCEEACVNGSLTISLTITVYKIMDPKNPDINGMNGIVAANQLKAKCAEECGNDLLKSLKNDENRDITLIANDGVAMMAHRFVLKGRSQVFKAMLDADMAESNTGVIIIADVDSRALRIVLAFMYSGELDDDWFSKGGEMVINAAEKYDLKGLKDFCDLTLGAACTKENRQRLLVLAKLHRMQRAEQDLLGASFKLGA